MYMSEDDQPCLSTVPTYENSDNKVMRAKLLAFGRSDLADSSRRRSLVLQSEPVQQPPVAQRRPGRGSRGSAQSRHSGTAVVTAHRAD